MIDCVVSGFDPVKLLSLMKHPLASFGMPRADVRRAARFLELRVLRGPRLGDGLKPLLDEFARKQAKELEKLGAHIALPEVWQIAAHLLERFSEAIAPLISLMDAEEEPSFGEWLAGVISAVEAVAMDKDGLPDRLYDEAAGRSIQDFFDRASLAASISSDLSPQGSGAISGGHDVW